MDSKKLERIHNYIEMIIRQSSIPAEARMDVEDATWDAFKDKIIEKEKEIININSYIQKIANNKIADYYREKEKHKKLNMKWKEEIIQLSDFAKPIYKVYEDKLKKIKHFKDQELGIASAEKEPGYLGFINSAMLKLLKNDDYNPIFEWIRKEFIDEKEMVRKNAHSLILLWLILRHYLGIEKGDSLFAIWALVLMQDSSIRVPSRKTIELSLKKRKIYDLKHKNPEYDFKEIARIDDIKLNPNEVKRLYLQEIRSNKAVDKEIDKYREGYTEFEIDISRKLFVLKKILQIKEDYAQ